MVEIEPPSAGRASPLRALRAGLPRAAAYLARMQALIESSHDAIVTLNERGVVEAMNPVAVGMFGADRGSAIGRAFWEVFVAEQERVAYSLQFGTDFKGAQDGLPFARREADLLRADGSVIPAVISSILLPTDDRGSVACFIRASTLSARAGAELLGSRWQLQDLARRVGAAREQERQHIARELHDELGQELTAIHMDVAWLLLRTRMSSSVDPGVVERLEAVSQHVSTTFDTVRRLATSLRPRMLDDLGLIQAIRRQAREFETRSGIQVDVDAEADDPRITADQSTAIFRIFQELLTNVGRHAQARKVQVRLRSDALHVTLRVSDDGRGIPDRDLAGGQSLGLLGIRERADLLGGSFLIGRGEREGTVATVALPCGVDPE